jgi:hypothetical protein
MLLREGPAAVRLLQVSASGVHLCSSASTSLKKARLSSKLALRLKEMLNVLEDGQHSQYTQGGTMLGVCSTSGPNFRNIGGTAGKLCWWVAALLHHNCWCAHQAMLPIRTFEQGLTRWFAALP